VKIGYLHLGEPEHGLNRYGRLLAAEAKVRNNLSVFEINTQLGKNWLLNLQILRSAARELSKADIIHIQYNKSIWGGALCILNLAWFLGICQAPVVATMHDVYWEQPVLNLSNPLPYLKARYGPIALSVQILLNWAQKILVCTHQEKSKFEAIKDIQHLVDSKLVVIPHFIENRKLHLNSEEARISLNLGKEKIVTLLGWIHPRKGHHLLVEAMPNLPTNIKVIFAGKCSPGSEGFLNDLQDLARSLGVLDRLLITGYLSEDELNQYLAATDIAVCPFKTCSASGSISTWISALKSKILVYNLPQIHEYNYLEPGVIKTFEPYSCNALSDAIIYLLTEKDDYAGQKINNVRKKLLISSIYDIHLKYFEEVYMKNK
jgi:glycosyltransferase involved in cell wall biosynthesis